MRDGDTLYLDYQASTPIDPNVLVAMERSLRRDFANPHAAEHALGWRAHAEIERAAEVIGDFAGVDGDHVIFTSGATEANWLAIAGFAAGYKADIRRIVISTTEHKSVESAAEASARWYNFEVKKVGVDASGIVDPDRLRATCEEGASLVSIIAVGNEVGAINDIAAIRGALGENVLLHVDASQAPSAVDVGELLASADLVTLSSHKAYGPKGVGALLASPEVIARLAPIMPGGTQQRGLRPGTLPTSLCVGFAAALTRMSECIGERKSVAALRDRFVRELVRLSEGVSMIGPPAERRHPGNACVRFDGVDAQDLLQALQPRIAASSQSACNSGSIEPSSALLAMGMSSTEARECVRFSIGRFSDQEQILEAAQIVANAVLERRKLARRIVV